MGYREYKPLDKYDVLYILEELERKNILTLGDRHTLFQEVTEILNTKYKEYN